MGNFLSNMSKNKTVQEIGKGTVTVGKVFADVKLIVSIVFFIIFLITSIVLITRPSKKYIKVKGTVLAIGTPNTPMCQKETNTVTNTNTDSKNNTSSSTTTSTFYDCSFNVSYTPVGGNKITKPFSLTSSTPLTNGETVDVYYLKDDTSKSYVNSKPVNAAHAFAIFFFVLTFIALISVISFGINAFIVSKSNIAAGIEGTGAATGLAIGTAKNVINMV